LNILFHDSLIFNAIFFRIKVNNFYFYEKYYIMKTIKFGLFALTAALFVACGGGGEKEKIAGEWNLTGFSDDGKKVELTDCDQQTIWNFTTESAEALGDGTAVHKLNAKAPEECKFYSFDSKWTVKDGSLFISTSRIGGMGGFSMAGLMDIVELTDNKLVLKSMKKELTLEK
jgi:hypothetical protein